MSDKVLSSILDTLQTINIRLEQIDSRFEQIDSRFEQIDARFEKIETRIDGIGVELQSIKADTKEIPYIKQAVMETYENTQQLNNNHASFERHVLKELTMHAHSIDILNRRQLKLEAEFERSKGK